MKKLILRFSVLFCLLLSCGGNDKERDSYESESNESNEIVIICSGEYSHSYHDHECLGLSNCSTDFEEITIEEAEDEGRAPCGHCY